MNINIAHVNIQGIHCLICEADHPNHTPAGRQALLAQLTAKARANNLRVQKSALAFREHGRLTYYGTPDLVEYLSIDGLPVWTHTLAV